MVHIYKISNMTCSGCTAHVKSQLLKQPHVLSADISLPDTAAIKMDKSILLKDLQDAIGSDSKYRISEISVAAIEANQKISFIKTYKPLLIIFLFITGISFIASIEASEVHYKLWMQYFMAAFFITFSFFKFLDLKSFAESYAMYDVLAMRFKAYGYSYPFLELALGLSYLIGTDMQIVNIATILVMSFSSIGVIQSVLHKRKIQCACLGAVFNLPMSTVTVIEDLLMVLMAACMLII